MAATDTTRAESLYGSVDKIPADIIDKAVDIVRQHHSFRLPKNREAVQRMVERWWPGYVKSRIAALGDHFQPDRDLAEWSVDFQCAVHQEDVAMNRYQIRRQKWDQKHPAREMTKEQIWARENEREALRQRLAEMDARRAARRKQGTGT